MSAEAMRDALPEIAERTHAQLTELWKEPSAERADIAATAAYGLYVHLRRLAAELEIEGRHRAA